MRTLLIVELKQNEDKLFVTLIDYADKACVQGNGEPPSTTGTRLKGVITMKQERIIGVELNATTLFQTFAETVQDINKCHLLILPLENQLQTRNQAFLAHSNILLWMGRTILKHYESSKLHLWS